MNTQFKVFIARERIWGDRFEVRFARRVGNKMAIAQPLQMVAIEEDDYARETPVAIALSRDEAQAFMDELWNVGIRPSEGSGSAGSLAATQRHLDDMRTIAFKTLEIPK